MITDAGHRPSLRLMSYVSMTCLFLAFLRLSYTADPLITCILVYGVSPGLPPGVYVGLSRAHAYIYTDGVTICLDHIF